MSQNNETTTRKLVEQVWKPLAGRKIRRYVAMSASHSVPGQEWTDSLQGGSYVKNQVIGYAELRSGRKFPAVETFREFADQIEEEADYVNWLDGWEMRAESPEEPPELPEGPTEDEEVETDDD